MGDACLCYLSSQHHLVLLSMVSVSCCVGATPGGGAALSTGALVLVACP